MKLIIAIVLIGSIRIDESVANICDETNNKPIVLEAFRVTDKLFVTIRVGGNGQKLYKLDGMKYIDNQVTYQSFVEVKNLPTWFDTVKLFFTSKLPNDPDKPAKTKVIAIGYHTAWDTMKILLGWIISFDKTYDSITETKQFNVDLYKYVPGEDPLNLMSLFQKFPQNEIQNRMMAIMAFPSASSYRLMVYFNDKPDKEEDKEGPDDPGFEFRRHIMLAHLVDLDKVKEFDWRHDSESGNCYVQNIINAAVALTDDYNKTENTLSFDLIEFGDEKYFVKRVFIDDKVVRKDLEELNSGTVAQFFKCETPTTTTMASEDSVITTIASSDQSEPQKSETGLDSETSATDSMVTTDKPLKGKPNSTKPEDEKSKVDKINSYQTLTSNVLLMAFSVIVSISTVKCLSVKHIFELFYG